MTRRARRITLTVLFLVFLALMIAVSIPFHRITYMATETFQENETTNEPFTEREPYTTSEIVEREELVYEDTPFSVPNGVIVPFSVSSDNSRLTGSFALPAAGAFYLYSVAGKILYEQRGQKGKIDLPVAPGKYEVRLREGTAWGEKMALALKLGWSETVDITRYREVTRYRDITRTVEKQRTVTTEKMASTWEIIFSK